MLASRFALLTLVSALATTLTACGGGGGGEPGSHVNSAPVAHASALSDLDTGATLSLDGSASSDVDGDRLTYAWTILQRPAASVAAVVSPTAAKPTFVPDAGGTYVLALVVNDGQVSSPATEVTVTASTPIGGVLAAPMVLTQAMSPYRVVSDLTVPFGSSLTVQAGVTVKGLDKKLAVKGVLQVVGTAAEPVNLSNLTIYRDNLASEQQYLDGCQVSIAWANVTGGSVYAPNLPWSMCPFHLTDSHLQGTGLIDIQQGWRENTIDRNVFDQTEGIRFHLGSALPHKTTLSIQNNRFTGWTGGFAIKNTGRGGNAEALVRRNSFLSPDRIAIVLSDSAFDLDVQGNYWGTQDETVIRSMGFTSELINPAALTQFPALPAADSATP